MKECLDSHIKQWREAYYEAPDEKLKQRAIDACDALQQLRLGAFGSLLPLDDGTFAVFNEQSELLKFETEQEAVTQYAKS